jgi:peptide/nickel transport system ATP-binding protein
MAIMLITHDLGVVAETAQRVIVMYAGKIVEEAEVSVLFGNPAHPYTRGLLHSIPRYDKPAKERRRLEAIPGVVPSMLNLPRGCRFAPRCQYEMDICREKEPPLFERNQGHRVRCWLAEGKE